MVSDLRADLNSLVSQFKDLRTESKAVTIASISLIVTVLALLMAFMALSDAKEANIRSEMQTQTIDDLDQSVKVLRIRSAKMDAWLKAHGVPTKEVYDD